LPRADGELVRAGVRPLLNQLLVRELAPSVFVLATVQASELD
jgi:hypothetical protein